MKYTGILEQAYRQRKHTRKLIARIKQTKPSNLDEVVHGLHDEVFQKINCLDCGNCCQRLGPLFTHTDIKRISKHLGMDELTFAATYLRKDEDGDTVFQSMPCPFINEQNICSIYEVRPKACAEYPHTDRQKFHQALGVTEKNALTCPAVVKIIEGLEKIYK